MTEPPVDRGLAVQTAWPFIVVVESQQTRSGHLTMAVLMGVLTAIILATTIPAVFAVVPAFVVGYETHNWAVFDQLYGGESA